MLSEIVLNDAMLSVVILGVSQLKPQSPLRFLTAKIACVNDTLMAVL